MKQSSCKKHNGRFPDDSTEDYLILKKHLVGQKLLSSEEIYRAEDYALTRGISFEEALFFLNLCDYSTLGRWLSQIYDRPYHSLLAAPPPSTAKRKISLRVAERFLIFPAAYCSEKKLITIAVKNPEDGKIMDKLRNVFPDSQNIDIAVASEIEIREAIDVYYKGKVLNQAVEVKLPEDFTIIREEKGEKDELSLEEKPRIEKKVLLLEPNLTRAKALKAILRCEGYQDVEWVMSSDDVIKILSSQGADMLLVNGRAFQPQGSWIKAVSRKVSLPSVSYYDLTPLLLGQAHPYQQMSEAFIGLLAFMVRKIFKNDPAQLQEILTKVRYSKLLALRLNMLPAQVDGCIVAAWLSSNRIVKDQLLDQIATPYRLQEIFTDESGKRPREEKVVLELVQRYQELKIRSPKVTEDINHLRKLLGPNSGPAGNDTILEAFLQLIRDEEFLKGVDQPASRILVVDPDQSEDSSMILRLSNDGYEVVTVSEASTAVEKIKELSVDIIVSEVRLPGTDGLRFCKVLRENDYTAQIPFFFLTGEEGERLAAECLEAGADDFLKKPVDQELLSLKIQRILAMKAPKEGARGVTGSLADMNATDFIQSLSEAQKNIEIRLEYKGEKGKIYIQSGEIVHANVGKLKGEEAFYKLMIWKEGRFQIVPCAEFPPRTIHAAVISLLMEGARLADEFLLNEED